MAQREDFSAGIVTITGEDNGAVVVLRKDSSGKITECKSSSAPSGAGYAVGCIFINTSTGKISQNEGTTSVASFNIVGDITTADIGANVVTPVKMGTRTVVALTDAAATPTIAQLMTSSQFTITPTTARTFTVPTAALTVAGITGATVGTWFDFSIVNTAAFAVTVTGNTGWTTSGNMVVNKGAATFRAILTNVTGGAEAVTVYRQNSGATVTDMALASGKMYVGQATGLADEKTLSGAITTDVNGVTSLGANVVTPVKMGTRTEVALTDAAATPTIAQLMTSSQFTMTPTAARTFTLPTAADVVAGITGATVGTWFDFGIVNTAAFAVTVTGNTGWTTSGNMVVNKGAATFRAILTNVTGGAEAVTVYRQNSGATVTDMALASGKMYVGQATGLAAEVTPSADVTIDTAGAVTIASAVVTRAKQSAPALSKGDNVRPATIATTGNTDQYHIVEETGALASIDFSGVDALAAHDTNYITFSVTNLGQAGGGSTAMLAATDENTTKATGGTALSANTKRSLTVHGTGANLDVVKGDRLLVRAAASGTLANTVTFPVYCMRLSGTT